ncbi:ABC transporter permease [candidate division KSB1 bacterium]
MFKNYLTIAFRNILRQKGFSFINLSGLAIGMACCILILLFVQDELSFDRYHENSDRLYRVVTDAYMSGTLSQFARCPLAIPTAITAEIPEIESSTRLFAFGRQIVAVEDRIYEETGVFAADSTFFSLFTHEFIAGDKETALDAPGSVVITESTANKLFGDKDVIGKTFRYQAFGTLQVTGVIRDVPVNSHFQFKYIVSFSTFPAAQLPNIIRWQRLSGYAYILLADRADPKVVKNKIMEVYEKYGGEEGRGYGIDIELFLQKITDIHLRSNLQAEIEPNGDFKTVLLFSAIAFFILFIACINFMNLSTARSARRAREVGLRKVFGACKTNLISQFLMESIILSLIGLVLAIGISTLALSKFNILTGKVMTIASLGNTAMITVMIVIVIFTGLIAGIYPAFFLSGFQPSKTLHGSLSQGLKNSNLRRGLVVLQFALSVMLIISTGVILDQIEFMKKKELGFNKERVLVAAIQSGQVRRNPDLIKNELMKNPNIIDFSATSGSPGQTGEQRPMVPEGNDQTASHLLFVLRGDHNFINIFKMEIVAGRDFSPEIPSDMDDAFIINETCAKTLGWTPDEAIGKGLDFLTVRQGHIVGVVKDFHFRSIKENIGPMVIMAQRSPMAFAAIRISENDMAGTIEYIQSVWEKLEQGREFNYFFIDERFQSLYTSEKQMSDILSLFALFAIFIACLGLFGLASYTTQQRTKEIGIRKVLGASVKSVVLKLSTEFIKWVVIANIIAFPAAVVILRKYWLVNFPYKTGLSVWIFISAFLLSVLIAVITVLYQSIKAAIANPVNSLRQE